MAPPRLLDQPTGILLGVCGLVLAACLLARRIPSAQTVERRILHTEQLYSDDDDRVLQEQAEAAATAALTGSSASGQPDARRQPELQTTARARNPHGHCSPLPAAVAEGLPAAIRDLCPVVRRGEWAPLLRFFQQDPTSNNPTNPIDAPPGLRVYFEYVGGGEGAMEKAPCHRVAAKEGKAALLGNASLLPYTAKFVAEMFVPEALRLSPYATVDRASATLRFVEACVQGRGQQGQYLPTAMATLQGLAGGREWAERRGSGDAMVLTGDHGPCQNFKERSGLRDSAPRHNDWHVEAMANMTLVQHEGSTLSGCYRPGRDVVIPTPVIATVSPLACRRKLGARTHLAFLAGKASSKLRVRFAARFAGDGDFLMPSAYLSHNEFLCQMAQSVFCLCPRGQAAWSPRLEESLHAGCIPVILSDWYEPPFSHILDYAQFAVRIPLASWADTKELLAAIPQAERARLLGNGRLAQRVFRYDRRQPLQYRGQDMVPLLAYALARRLRAPAQY